ncbi:transporter substrate-binding domain-containing protein [Paucibacter sp. AS339]|uniref:substrate-binding periplasmic protein n=1 Tax=Paucibacter hankyongi TaxID=3133434 RepID=UPI0030AF194F
MRVKRVLRWMWVLALGSLALCRVEAADLRVLVDTSASMPYARFEGGELRAGLSRDLGLELARRLGREVQFVPVARKRLAATLQAGQADLVCGYASHWLSGPFQWSRPMAQHEDILITRADAAAPRSLSDVADQAVGAIAGFRYAGIERQLGARFIRDDGPDAQALLRRLAAKRISHAIVSRSYLEFQRQQGNFTQALHPPLQVDKVALRCALAQGADLSLAQLDETLSAMQKDGFLQHLP